MWKVHTNSQLMNEGQQPSEQLPNLVKQDGESIVSSAQVRLTSTVCAYVAAMPVKINEMRGPALIESESLTDGCLQVDQSLVEMG